MKTNMQQTLSLFLALIFYMRAVSTALALKVSDHE